MSNINKRIGVRISEEVKTKLEVKAKKQNRKLSDYVRLELERLVGGIKAEKITEIISDGFEDIGVEVNVGKKGKKVIEKLLEMPVNKNIESTYHEFKEKAADEITTKWKVKDRPVMPKGLTPIQIIAWENLHKIKRG